MVAVKTITGEEEEEEAEKAEEEEEEREEVGEGDAQQDEEDEEKERAVEDTLPAEVQVEWVSPRSAPAPPRSPRLN